MQPKNKRFFSNWISSIAGATISGVVMISMGQPIQSVIAGILFGITVGLVISLIILFHAD